MKKLEIIIRPEKLEALKTTLQKNDITGMTVNMVSGCGKQKGYKELYRGTELVVNLLPKIKVEIVVHDDLVEDLTERICESVKTGEVGDGKIFISNIEGAIKIRTGEKNDSAL